MPTIEELKKLRAQAKIDQAAAKKESKKKPPKPKKKKHYAEGGEEQWEDCVAPPRPVPNKKNRDGGQLLETYQLPTGEWSFSPKPDGPVSIYSVRAKSIYRWNGKEVFITPHAGNIQVWWYSPDGIVKRGLANDPEAIRIRKKFVQSLGGYREK